MASKKILDITNNLNTYTLYWRDCKQNSYRYATSSFSRTISFRNRITRNIQGRTLGQNKTYHFINLVNRPVLIPRRWWFINTRFITATTKTTVGRYFSDTMPPFSYTNNKQITTSYGLSWIPAGDNLNIHNISERNINYVIIMVEYIYKRKIQSPYCSRKPPQNS